MINKIKEKFREYFWKYEKRARYSGVKMGVDNFIDSDFWSSEPYLISIGSHCQITSDVKFYTHGGQEQYVDSILILIHLEKFK